MKLMVHFARQPNQVVRASCPALPGCVVYGQSRSEATARLRTAIDGYLSHLETVLPKELSKQLAPAGPHRGAA